MFKDVDSNLEKEIDKVLHFVAKNLQQTGNNTKPVLFHSFKLGKLLYTHKYSRTIIISGILHDLLEDTSVSVEEIKNEFGVEISLIVKALTFDTSIKDELKQAETIYENCLKQGFEALIIKCADLLDNINYVHLVKEKDKQKKLLAKYEIFFKIAENEIGKELIYKNLIKRYNEVKLELENE